MPRSAAECDHARRLRDEAERMFHEQVLSAEAKEIAVRRVVAGLLTPAIVRQLFQEHKKSRPLGDDPGFDPELYAALDDGAIAAILGQWRCPEPEAAKKIDRFEEKSAFMARVLADVCRHDRVGLAFSGGGIRSASFNLGLLQALQDEGVLRYVDYLSTVSGGGYLGSHLSAALLRSDVDALKRFPLRPDKSGKQPEPVVKLIHGGSYLNRPAQLFNCYLIGLLSNNLIFVSGVICLCASVAYLWRLLDQAPIHTFIMWVSGEILLDYLRPFVPAAVFLILWGTAWSVGAWSWSEQALGRRGKLLIEIMLGLGLGLLGGSAPHSYLIYGDRWAPLLFWLIVAGASHAQALSSRAHRWSHVLLVAAAVSLLIGAVVWLANPNNNMHSELRTGAAAHDGSYLTFQKHVIIPLLALLALCLLPFIRPWSLLRSGEKDEGSWQHIIFRIASYALLCGIPLAIVLFFARHNLSQVVDHMDRALDPSEVRSWEVFWTKVDRQAKQRVSQNAANPGLTLRNLLDGKVDPQSQKQIVDLLAPENLAELEWKTRRYRDWNTGAPKLYEQGPSFWDYQGRIKTHRNITQAISEGLAGAQGVKFAAALLFPPDSAELARPLENDIEKLEETERTQLNKLLKLVKVRREEKQVDLAEALTGKQLKELNFLLLRAYYPDDLYPRTRVTRPLVIDEDQTIRLIIIGCSLLICLLSAVVVNFNNTSPHWFYYKQLRAGYNVTTPQGRRVLLRDLKNAEKGAPYHLLIATVYGGIREQSNLLSAASFMFSKCFCGSPDLGYAPTSQYRGGTVELATAMAISGAAFSPLRVSNPLVAVLMTVLNFRLGQWFPKPSPTEPRRSNALRRCPTGLGLFVDGLLAWRQGDFWERRFYFLSDGGHEENLGIEQLLLRRCALVIASDAGQDPTHGFVDLVKLYRRLRLQGIRLYSLSDQHEFLSLEDLELDQQRNCRTHYVCALIRYPKDDQRGIAEEQGILIYVKPSFTGDEEFDLVHFRREHPNFPHDPTSEVIYDPNHVESYRQLGEYIGRLLCRRLEAKSWGDAFRVETLFVKLPEPLPSEENRERKKGEEKRNMVNRVQQN